MKINFDDQIITISTIDEVIKQVKAFGRIGWIWGDDGELSKDAIVCDIFPILEDLKEYEIVEPDAERVIEILEDGEADNTYNWGAKISNHISIISSSGVGILCAVHLSGDVRGNYSDFFLLKDNRGYFFDIESSMQEREILADGENYGALKGGIYAYPCIFSDGYDINIDNDYINEIFYEDDRESALKAILEYCKNNTEED